MFGPFSYYSVLAYPSALGAIVCSRVLTDKVIYYYAHGLSTIAIQVSILRGDFYIFKLIRNYRAIATAVLMTFNALMLHGMRECKNEKYFWIVQPIKSKEVYNQVNEKSPFMDYCSPEIRSELKQCDHQNSCDSYIRKV